MKILLTGGAGFIGSHTCVELVSAGHEPVIVDNLYNASPKVLERLKVITGREIPFYEADVSDEKAMNAIFEKERFDAVIHFAGYKAFPSRWNITATIWTPRSPCASACAATASSALCSVPPLRYMACATRFPSGRTCAPWAAPILTAGPST